VRKSIAFVVRQAGQRTRRNQQPAVIAAPIVGENSIGMCLAWRSFQAAIRRSLRGARQPLSQRPAGADLPSCDD
jgi:hypothetical protein